MKSILVVLCAVGLLVHGQPLDDSEFQQNNFAIENVNDAGVSAPEDLVRSKKSTDVSNNR